MARGRPETQGQKKDKSLIDPVLAFCFSSFFFSVAFVPT